MGIGCAEDKGIVRDEIGYANIWYLGRGPRHVIPAYQGQGPFGDEWKPHMPNANVCTPCLRKIPRDLFKKEPPRVNFCMRWLLVSATYTKPLCTSSPIPVGTLNSPLFDPCLPHALRKLPPRVKI